MSDDDKRGLRVLDYGTGTGLQAMAAFLGCARTENRVDIEKDAIDSARQSAAVIDDLRFTDNRNCLPLALHHCLLRCCAARLPFKTP